MADALHTPGSIVQAVEARLDDGGLLTPLGPGAMDIRTGVMAGPGSTAIVTGTSATGTMTVSIAPHHWVTTRGSASGPYRGAREAATTATIAAAPASGSRIDVVYVKQQSTEAGIPSPDGTAGELYGVLQGTSGTTPAKPDLSTIVGAEELATIQIAAGTTSTNGSGATITNTARQTVARGGVLPVTSSTRPANPWDGLVIVETDTDRLYSWTGSAWQYLGGGVAPAVAITLSANWVAANGTFGGGVTINEAPRCWVQPDGTIRCTGAISNTASVAVTTYTPWITLPAGYRPAVGVSRVVEVTANATNTPALFRADIAPTGAVTLGNAIALGAGTLYSIDWSFRPVNT